VSKKSHCQKLSPKSLNSYSIQLVKENFLQVHIVAFHTRCENKAFLWILVAQRSIIALQYTMNMTRYPICGSVYPEQDITYL
jgi:hypothetical protein